MKYLKAKILTISVLTLSVSAVSAVAGTGELGSRRWQLAELNGMPVGRTKAFIQFDENQSRFSGNAGCNSMFGSFAVIGRRIEFSRIGTTRMLCADRNASRTEAALVKALESATRFRLAGNNLEFSNRNRVVVRFEASRGNGGGRDDVGLADKKWMLESIKGTPIAKAARGAFLSFDPKKMSAGGDSSCNAFGGSYTVDAKKLAITDIVSTLRACIEDERMEIERQFLDALRTINRFEIDNGKLKLYRGNRLLLTFRGDPK